MGFRFSLRGDGFMIRARRREYEIMTNTRYKIHHFDSTVVSLLSLFFEGSMSVGVEVWGGIRGE